MGKIHSQHVCDGMTYRYTFDVKRIRTSTTQGEVSVRMNGEEVARFGDRIELTKHPDGRWVWQSNVSDAEFIMAALYHRFDGIYRFSDNVKEVIGRDIKNAEAIRGGLEISKGW